MYFERMKKLKDLKITFIPIDKGSIRNTYSRFCNEGLNVSIESNTAGINLSSVIDSVTKEHYESYQKSPISPTPLFHFFMTIVTIHHIENTFPEIIMQF